MKITPVSTLEGNVNLPPDKSIAHRSALFASLSEETSVIHNYSNAADPQSTISCLKQLGVDISQDGTTVTVKGVGRNGFKTPSDHVDCGNSGTTMRLLSGIISGAGIEATLFGDASLSGRPMKRIMNPLKEMGADFTAREENYPPFIIHANNGLKSMVYDLPVASAQVKSCVLLAGLFAEGETQVIERIPTRDHTERLLKLPQTKREDGATVISSNRNIVIPAQNYSVPGDFSAATFWMVAGSIVKGSFIEIPNVGMNASRTAALHILKRMGAEIQVTNEREVGGGEPVADLVVRYSPLKATVIEETEVPNCIDELPILSVAMSFADGISSFTGAEELRFKECDRIMAVSKLLENAGVLFIEQKDGLTIHGDPEHVAKSATYETWHDHRIAMSAAIMSLKSDSESEILNADAASISYPSFYMDLEGLSK
ncbi:MAG: 3-phosphoshikimate 1-carboxyvinyltransferase [Bacteroidetes bacterium]|nr:3-phosphoshikimate 1-carboxyvinyltransferase [Bacteroidota bacterium]NCQ11026.1 3-phosphoshikimate 1-carboxyvinyltransferase [Bacteroidota bacterium]